jgi:uncharacterized MnhB-related membrane protein
MLIVILIVLSVGIIASAIYAVKTASLMSAVVASGAVSLLASVQYLIFFAPDVAMTEAAIGSGLMTVIFFLVLSRMKRETNG